MCYNKTLSLITYIHILGVWYYRVCVCVCLVILYIYCVYPPGETCYRLMILIDFQGYSHQWQISQCVCVCVCVCV